MLLIKKITEPKEEEVLYLYRLDDMAHNYRHEMFTLSRLQMKEFILYTQKETQGAGVFVYRPEMDDGEEKVEYDEVLKKTVQYTGDVDEMDYLLKNAVAENSRYSYVGTDTQGREFTVTTNLPESDLLAVYAEPEMEDVANALVLELLNSKRSEESGFIEGIVKLLGVEDKELPAVDGAIQKSFQISNLPEIFSKAVLQTPELGLLNVVFQLVNGKVNIDGDFVNENGEADVLKLRIINDLLETGEINATVFRGEIVSPGIFEQFYNPLKYKGESVYEILLNFDFQNERLVLVVPYQEDELEERVIRYLSENLFGVLKERMGSLSETGGTKEDDKNCVCEQEEPFVEISDEEVEPEEENPIDEEKKFPNEDGEERLYGKL